MRSHRWHHLHVLGLMLIGMAIAGGGTTAVAGASVDFLTTASLLSDSSTQSQPVVAEPAAVGDTYVDPVFGTTIQRVTKSPAPGSSSGPAGITPEYSKAQAWSANQSRVLLRGTDASWHLYNGVDFSGPLPLSLPVGDIEPRWSPTNPNRIYYLLGRSVYSYTVSSGASRRITRVRGLGGELTSGAEQDIPLGGLRLVVHGPEHYDARGRWSWTRAAVVDLATGKVGRRITLRRPAGSSGDFLDYVAIAPDGRRLIVMWAFHGADLYTRRWKRLRRLTSWDEHGDFCRDTSGKWWFVQARYRPVPNDELIVASSLDGLARRSLWMAPRYNLAVHISCRNQRMPGWAFVSTYWDGLGQRPDDAPIAFENEVFALSLQSSVATPVVRRLAHTRMNERADYFDEPHATVSRDGRMVLFASNFGQYVSDEEYDDTYAIDLRSL